MTRARAAATSVTLLGAALLLGASDAAGEREAASPAQTVTTKDGGLTVSVPAGALAKPVRVRVRTLTRAQFPPELRNAKVRPGSKLYELEPSGLRFLKAVTITRRIDTRVAGFAKNAVPGVVLASRDRGGKWEMLKSLNARVNGTTLTVVGTTRHFSTLLSLDEGFSLSLVPAEVEAFVGDEWVARVVSKIDNRRRRDPIRVDSDETKWGETGAVERGKNITYLQQTFRCARVGTGTYSAFVTVAESSLAVFLGSLGGNYDESFVVSGNARCKARTTPPTPTPSLELTAACVAATHTPFGNFPSFLRWLLGFRPAGVPRKRAGGADRRRDEQRPAHRRHDRPHDGQGRAPGRDQLVRAEADAAARRRRAGPDLAARREDRRRARGHGHARRDRRHLPLVRSSA